MLQSFLINAQTELELLSKLFKSVLLSVFQQDVVNFILHFIEHEKIKNAKCIEEQVRLYDYIISLDFYFFAKYFIRIAFLLQSSLYSIDIISRCVSITSHCYWFHLSWKLTFVKIDFSVHL